MITQPPALTVYRLLIIDDNVNIHEDIRKVLLRTAQPTEIASLEQALFGDPQATSEAAPTHLTEAHFEIDSAYQGEEGVDRVREARASGRPYAMAFVDMRMPPGIDGLATIERIWKVDPDLQVVICSAYSDYTWAEIMTKLGLTDRLVILRKPFDNIEVLQLAHTLTEKWNLQQKLLSHLNQLEQTITQRTQALRESQEMFQLILENAADLITVIDVQGNRVYSSPSHGKVLGYDRDELNRTTAFAQVHPEDRTLMEATIAKVRACGVSETFVCRMEHKDGTWRSLESCAGVVRDAQHNFAFLVIVARDITERQQREMQLRLNQKLESMGLLAAGIAHEINTPTQYISDNTRFLIESFQQLQRVIDAQRAVLRKAQEQGLLKDEVDAADTVAREMELDYLRAEIPRTLTQSLDGLERVTKIVRALKEFSHPGSPTRAALDINHALENAAMVCRHEWKYVADLAMEFDPALPLVPCLADEFNQAILNLMINAAHAIADTRKPGSDTKGRITLRTRADGEWAVIEIADTGAGIPPGIRERIFEPFFTTKPMGKGTGQGLPIVRSVIVGKHHGSIDFTSEVGRGTTFILRLPLKAPEEKSAPQAAA